MTIERLDSGEIIVRIPYRAERPYDPQRASLYSPDELMTPWGGTGKSLDQSICDYYDHEGGQIPRHPNEALCQRIHDDYVDRQLIRFIDGSVDSKPERRKIVGIMGGHVEDRTGKYYAMVAQIAYQLTNAGYCILTGGGPGVMEAGNLGAYMSDYTLKDLMSAIAMLSAAPAYPKLEHSDPDNAAMRRRYIDVASAVRERYPDQGKSLGVPTWAYPDEPTGQFATHIAKYFANSIREDGLLAISAHGVIFAPGGAGTAQEIFQDAAHNSYWSFGSRGPMVFLGSDVYRRSPSLYDVVLAAANRDGYSDFLALLDDPAAVSAFIQSHPPVKKPGVRRTVGLSGFELAL